MAIATIKATTKRNRRRRARARLAAVPGRPAQRTAGLNEKAAKIVRRIAGMVQPHPDAVRAHLRDRLTAASHRVRGRMLLRLERCSNGYPDKELIGELVGVARQAMARRSKAVRA